MEQNKQLGKKKKKTKILRQAEIFSSICIFKLEECSYKALKKMGEKKQREH